MDESGGLSFEFKLACEQAEQEFIKFARIDANISNLKSIKRYFDTEPLGPHLNSKEESRSFELSIRTRIP